MRQLGRLDVTVNGGKRGSDTTNGEPPKTQIKKPKKGEINFLPDFPEGMNDQNMEVAREVLVNEMMKTKPKESLVKKEMDVTFAFRRKEIVKEKPAISQLVYRWPALFTENQVSYEFGRVVGKNLRENFLDALDHLSPSLMDLCKKKKGLTDCVTIEDSDDDAASYAGECIRNYNNRAWVDDVDNSSDYSDGDKELPKPLPAAKRAIEGVEPETGARSTRAEQSRAGNRSAFNASRAEPSRKPERVQRKPSRAGNQSVFNASSAEPSRKPERVQRKPSRKPERVQREQSRAEQ
ncbi:hypothetical protein C0J45_4698 [Silurus meridionalis]|nr:hypothetical protein C0J45_4698 [Silurus meridionalis]